MLNPKTCREHASKCTQVADSFPPGPQREMFLDMAERWISIAANIESSEAILDQHSEVGPYRFGSRVDHHQRKQIAPSRNEAA